MDRTAIARRLRDWGIRKYGSVNALAAAIGVHQSTISQYLHGKRIPGPEMQQRLRNIGADIEWIMTGITTSETSKSVPVDASVFFFAPEGISARDRKRYEALARLIAKVPPDETETIRELIRAYLRSKR